VDSSSKAIYVPAHSGNEIIMEDILQHIRHEAFKKELEKLGASVPFIELMMKSRMMRNLAKTISPKFYKDTMAILEKDTKQLKSLRRKQKLGHIKPDVPKGERRKWYQNAISKIQKEHPQIKEFRWKKELR